MGNAFLIGSGSSSGVREKRISKAMYDGLSESDKKNPHVIWIVEDASATNLGAVKGAEIIQKICTWATYQTLSVDDKNDPGVIWMISDKTPEDLARLGYGATTGKGSSLYNISGELDMSQVATRLTELEGTVNLVVQALNDMTQQLNQLNQS